MKYNLSKIEIDLLFINILSILLLFIIIFFPSNILRPILGFPFVLFFLGYTLIAVLFPKRKDIDDIERVALSLGVSVSVVPLIVILLNFTPLGIRLYPCFLSLFFLILTTSTVAWYRRFRLPPEEQFTITIHTLLLRRVKRINLKSINVLMMFTLLTLIGMFIRFYPYLNYSLYRGLWFPAVAYPTLYTIKSGNLLYIGAVDLPTRFSSIADNIIHLKSFTSLQACLFLVSGITDLRHILLFNKFIPWPGTFLFPLSVILISHRLMKVTNRNLSISNYILIYLMATFTSFSTIFITKEACVEGVYGYSLIVLSFYALLGKGYPDKILAILFSFSLPLFYHTASIVYLTLMLVFFISQFLIISLLLLFLYWRVRGKIQHPASNFLIHLIVGSLAVGALFLAWGGFKGALSRSEQYISILSLMMLPVLLSMRGKTKKLVVIISLLIIMTSISAYLTNDFIFPSYLTNGERNSIMWYSNYGSKEKCVFTDFRIGTPPILLDLFNFEGVRGYTQPDMEYFLTIYYGNSSLKTKKTLSKFRVDYVLLSKEMTKTYPGIITCRSQFKPMPNDFEEKYDSPYFNRVYYNGIAIFYEIRR